jgi:hypothetical protein
MTLFVRIVVKVIVILLVLLVLVFARVIPSSLVVLIGLVIAAAFVYFAWISPNLKSRS